MIDLTVVFLVYGVLSDDQQQPEFQLSKLKILHDFRANKHDGLPGNQASIFCPAPFLVISIVVCFTGHAV